MKLFTKLNLESPENSLKTSIEEDIVCYKVLRKNNLGEYTTLTVGMPIKLGETYEESEKNQVVVDSQFGRFTDFVTGIFKPIEICNAIVSVGVFHSFKKLEGAARQLLRYSDTTGCDEELVIVKCTIPKMTPVLIGQYYFLEAPYPDIVLGSRTIHYTEEIITSLVCKKQENK